MRTAMIDGNQRIVNFIVADPDADPAPQDTTLVACNDDITYSFVYDGKQFIPPEKYIKLDTNNIVLDVVLVATLDDPPKDYVLVDKTLPAVFPRSSFDGTKFTQPPDPILVRNG